MAKRKRSLLSKLIFWANIVAALLLLMAYLLPYIPPRSFPYISVLSLGMPVLLVTNFCFLVFWAIQLKREFLLSLIVLILGVGHLKSLYMFKTEVPEIEGKELKLMSYNVRQFNRYGWIKHKDIPKIMAEFITEEDPDIVSFQEYVMYGILLPQYKYQFKRRKVGNFGQAIFSKYPLLNLTSLDFPDSGNNVIYADAVVGEDTLRIFNMHMQSLSIDPDIKTLDKEAGKELTKGIGMGFKKQQNQLELLLKAVEESPYRTIINGDMNNTAFSYIYRKLAENHQDAFKAAGEGLGKTFVIDFLPLRIDFSFVDSELKIHDFKTYKVRLSDHYPIMTHIDL